MRLSGKMPPPSPLPNPRPPAGNSSARESLALAKLVEAECCTSTICRAIRDDERNSKELEGVSGRLRAARDDKTQGFEWKSTPGRPATHVT